jgi:hypothetical protein
VKACLQIKSSQWRAAVLNPGDSEVHIFVFASALQSWFKGSTHRQASSGIYVFICDAIFDIILLLSHATRIYLSNVSTMCYKGYYTGSIIKEMLYIEIQIEL